MAFFNRPTRLLVLIALAIFTCVSFVLYRERNSQDAEQQLPYDWILKPPVALDDRSQTVLKSLKGLFSGVDSDVDRVGNQTLGFEKVFAIGLPERSDKLDAVTLMAAMSGFKVTWVDAVKPQSIPVKAVPFGIETSTLKDNFLGSWRAHIDTVRTIVESGLSSALIEEDDMDWDVHIKTQLRSVAQGAHHVLQESSTSPHSPYGDTWDLLWLGHCGETFPERLEENLDLSADERIRISAKYVIHDDETVPPYEQVSKLVDWSAFPSKTRIVHRLAAPICSFVYAVSQRGVRKLLHALSIDGLHVAFNNSMAQLCRDATYDLAKGHNGGYGMGCLSVNPTVFFHHKAKGRLSRASDIQSYGGDDSTREQGLTESIMWSMRLSLMESMSGKPAMA